MPTKRTDLPCGGGSSTLPTQPCRHRDHNPPMHRVFGNGRWEHTCPGCGGKQWFSVNRPTW